MNLSYVTLHSVDPVSEEAADVHKLYTKGEKSQPWMVKYEAYDSLFP